MKGKNIKLLYIVNALRYSWFWLGTWIFYYKSFGGNAAVGILETVAITSGIILEIPTGAFADLLGKKRTLIFGYLFHGIGTIWMGLAPNLTHMIMSLVTLVIGSAFLSGTFEAMVFDTLKDSNEEKHFNKVISNMTSVQLVLLAISSAIGGYMYVFNHGLPYIATGFLSLIAVILSFFLIEPQTDSESFSIKNYIKQTTNGFKHLFKNNRTLKTTISVLLIAFITLIMYEGMNDIVAIAFGFTEIQLGYMASILTLSSATFSYYMGRVSEKVSSRTILIFSVLIFSLSMIISPWIGLIIGAVTLLIRFSIQPVIDNQISTILNESISSKYRATALSSFAMLKSLPYSLSIYSLSTLADFADPRLIVGYLGGGLFVALIFFYALEYRPIKHQD